MGNVGTGFLGLALVGLLGQSAAAHAALGDVMGDDESRMWMLGFQIHALTDGPAPGGGESAAELQDSYDDPNISTGFGWGTGISIPLTLNLYQGLGLRTSLNVIFSGTPLFDAAVTHISTLSPQISNGQTYWVGPAEYVELPAWTTGGSLATTLHYSFPLMAGTFKPYLGAGVGLHLVYVFSDLTGNESFLLENEYNDITDEGNIDPYSVNFQPGLNTYAGINFKVDGGLHLSLEAGYDLAYMPEAQLLKATDGSDARRAAYYLNLVRLSGGLLFNF